MKHAFAFSSLLTLTAVALWACATHEPQRATFAPLTKSERESATVLARRMRCTACHDDASERVWPELAPVLTTVGARRTPDGIRRWLTDPHGAKPGTAMPDLLANLAPNERALAIDELTHFLASRGGPIEQAELEVDVTELEQGRQLFHSIGCIACHTPQESAEDVERALWSFPVDEALVPQLAADLGNPAFDTTVDALAQFLIDPLRARPSGRMPSLKLSADEARAIALYLLRGRVRAEDLVDSPGLVWTYHEGSFAKAEPGFDGAPVVARGTASDFAALPEHRDDQFGFTFRGLLDAPLTGSYRFALKSDDGSNLWIDGKLVVANDGDHAPQVRSGDVWLESGRHAVVVSMYENGGGQELAVVWTPPRGEKEPLPASALSHWTARLHGNDAPFVLDAAKVERGHATFRAMGCASCHMVEGGLIGALRREPLSSIAQHLERGCLADVRDAGVPRFALDAKQRGQLRSLLADVDALQRPYEHDEAIAATMTRLDCFACHKRGERGGPDAERIPYFRALVEADLGNEGRLPPPLDGVGSKLKEASIVKVLSAGASERPYIATRMPQFGENYVALLPGHFAALDRRADDLLAPPFEAAHVELGRRLAGANGLGCIQCHRFNGVASLGIPAVDLARISERIQPGWFRRLLTDPKAVGMNSRMPELWQKREVDGVQKLASPAHDILDGDPARQIDALWSYLALGASMPFPEGLVVPDSEFELIPTTEPLLCAVFLEGASTRGMMVGNPELAHFAYDLDNQRLVWVWRGRFFNARGTWEGRAGGLEGPPSDDAVEFAKLAPLALLAQADAAWPKTLGRDAGFKTLGWTLDAQRRPHFRYALGDVHVDEVIVPVLRQGGATLLRTLVITSPAQRTDLYALLPGAVGSDGVPAFERRRVRFVSDGAAGFRATLQSEVTW